VLALGLAVHLVALRQAAWPLSAAGLVIVLVGLALLAGGSRQVAAYGLPIAVLALAIPVPWVERLAPPLAATVAHAAAGAAGLVGVPVVVTGAQVAVGSNAFVVGAPCSGLRSLVVLVTIAVILAGLSGLSAPRRALVVASALPLALAANGLRITALICAAGAVATQGRLAEVHAASGAALFVGSVIGLVSLAHGLGPSVPRGS
jgi:exosortase